MPERFVCRPTLVQKGRDINTLPFLSFYKQNVQSQNVQKSAGGLCEWSCMASIFVSDSSHAKFQALLSIFTFIVGHASSVGK